MKKAELKKCYKVIGYEFKNPDLLSLALTHASVTPSRFESNERLEFLGDAVLGMAVCEDLYRRHEDLLEGQMTKIKSTVVSRRRCAQIAASMGLADLLMLGKGLDEISALPQSIIAAVFEAVIGAIYLDGGYAAARDFILKQVRPHIEEARQSQHYRNYKSLLQEESQGYFSAMPEYILMDEKGPAHDKCFKIAVRIGERNFPYAWGRNKKQAEQQAARLALVELGLLEDEPEQSY